MGFDLLCRNFGNSLRVCFWLSWLLGGLLRILRRFQGSLGLSFCLVVLASVSVCRVCFRFFRCSSLIVEFLLSRVHVLFGPVVQIPCLHTASQLQYGWSGLRRWPAEPEIRGSNPRGPAKW